LQKKTLLKIPKENSSSLSTLADYASNILKKPDGIWYANRIEPVSYPSKGNDQCFGIEDKSFWFKHRNACIVELVKKFPPRGKGPIFDVGGGNGFVAKGLMDAGWDVVLVEPGPSGARNAQKRGLQNVVCATTQSAGFKPDSMPAIGVFDVVEHIDDDVEFMNHLHDLLEPGGMLYLTVPAYNFLWSGEDVFANHYRRYSLRDLQKLCFKVGFDVKLLTGIFQWLVAPIFCFRALPYRLLGKSKKKTGDLKANKEDHVLPRWLEALASRSQALELNKISQSRSFSFGGSLLLAAHKPLRWI
jgi:SAM-dependent methyltransferase